MLFKLLVLGRDKRVAQNFREIVVAVDDAALQRELTDDTILIVV